LRKKTFRTFDGPTSVRSQRGAHASEESNVLRVGANTVENPEKGEVLESMRSVEFRSLTSRDVQIILFEINGIVSNGIQLLVSSKNQNLLCVDG
jgi:hypothetical protein